nr:DUF2804 domain-containing protein [Microvirga antarctica]
MCLANGRLNPDAVGWSRTPLHRANLKGWGRNKRFEWWGIMTEDFVVTANISHHDYRANIASTFVDLKTRQTCGARENRWLPPVGGLSHMDGTAPLSAAGRTIEVRMTPNAMGTALYAKSARVLLEAQVFEEPGRESMGVLVPWSDRLFQYTRKNNCLLVEGRVVVDGIERAITRGDAYAIHDHGRGRWPYDTLWNWAAASGDTDGHQIGLQFGAKWTAGTPSTENVLRIDGRLHKISDELDWTYDTADWMKPWTIKGDRVDLTFTPVIHHHHLFDRVVISARLDQCFGHFDGTIVADDGQPFHVARVLGLAEEVRRKW